MMRLRFFLLIGALQVGACGSSPLMPSTGSGGTEGGTGGTPATGGSLGAGGTGATGGGTGTGGAIGAGGAAGSPGSVKFVLSAPPPGSYCDQISCQFGSVPHLSITRPDGSTVNITQTLCGTTDCDSCAPLLCPELAVLCPAPQGIPYTGGTWTWDGSYLAGATCGASHVACSDRTYAPAGRYVAHLCATPGSVVSQDAGLPACVSAGPPVCVQASFDFPGSGTVAITLPAPSVGQL